MLTKLFSMMFLAMFICVNAFAMCGTCGSNHEEKDDSKGVFSNVADKVTVKNGVKEITYEQFIKIRKSGEKYVLLDVLSQESYKKGHIEDAVSFPLDTIDKVTAEKRLPKSDNIIVYCGSFQCTASTGAAKKLSELGYNVLDYKGGLKEWQEKGNQLISGN